MTHETASAAAGARRHSRPRARRADEPVLRQAVRRARRRRDPHRAARRLRRCATAAPFIDDEPGPERSLPFAYFNTSKRGITLDLEKPRKDRSSFASSPRAPTSSSTRPGRARFQRWGCGYDALAARQPAARRHEHHALRPDRALRAVRGRGPRRARDRRLPLPRRLHRLAARSARTATRRSSARACTARSPRCSRVTRAELTGEGEHVDVSMQECVVMALENAVQFYDLEGKVRAAARGRAALRRHRRLRMRDGHIYMMASGIGVNKFWPLSLQWLVDEKVPGVERLQGEEWNSVEYLRHRRGEADLRRGLRAVGEDADQGLSLRRRPAPPHPARGDQPARRPAEAARSSRIGSIS